MTTETSEIKKNDLWSIIQVAITAVIVIGGFIVLIGYWRSKADVYIFPYGYTGKATVIYDQPSGAAEKFMGKKRVFEIPQDGILRTKFNYKGNLTEFYYRLPNGKLSQITENFYAHKDAPPQSPPPPGYGLGDTIEIAEIETIRPTKSNINTPVAIAYTVKRIE